MEHEKKVKLLQMIYAGVLADSVLRYGKAGILESVTAQKRQEQMLTGKIRATQFGIQTADQVFTALSDLFACADWKITRTDNGFTATAQNCMLCGICKKLGTESPCRIYCLDAMEGMIKGIDPNAEFNVSETLYTGEKCMVEVKA